MKWIFFFLFLIIGSIGNRQWFGVSSSSKVLSYSLRSLISAACFLLSLCHLAPQMPSAPRGSLSSLEVVPSSDGHLWPCWTLAAIALCYQVLELISGCCIRHGWDPLFWQCTLLSVTHTRAHLTPSGVIPQSWFCWFGCLFSNYV